MGYRIVITETGQEVRKVGKQWTRVAEGPDPYGYTPEVETIVDFEREVFKQHVNDLDLVKVIMAVNTVPEKMPEAQLPIWNMWSGGECPVSDDACVEWRSRCGSTGKCFAGDLSGWEWPHYQGERHDIVAYRVLS